MKRYLTFILVASAVLALPSSCSVKEQEPGATIGTTLFYGSASTESKLSVGDPYTVSSETHYKGLWESGDEVGVYRISDGASLGRASLIEGAGSQNGTFSLPGTIGDTDVRILYPANASYDGANSLPKLQRQQQGGANSFKDYDLAYSGITNKASGNNFTLHHVPAFIKVAVKAASTSDTWYGYSINSLTFRVPGAVISGQFTVDYESGEITPGQTVYDYVTVELDSPVTISTTEQLIWLAALPGDLSGCLVTVSLNLQKGSNSTAAMVKFTGRDLLSNSVNTLRIKSLQSIVSPGIPAAATEYSSVNVEARTNKSSSYTSYSARTVAGMNRMDKFLVDTRDQWGGYKGVKPEHITSTNSDGFWKTGTYHGRPMFVDPAGNIAFLCGMNSVIPDPLSDAADSRTTAYYNNRFGSESDWAGWCADNLADCGFNFFNTNPKRIRNYRLDHDAGMGISAEVQERLHEGNYTSQLSQTENLYFLRTFLWDYFSLTKKTIATNIDSPFLLIFDPGWQDYINKMAAYTAQFFKNDPNFVGYYTDNELPFCDTNDTYGRPISLTNFLEQETEDASSEYYYRCGPYAKAWAQKWMQDNYGTTTYSSSMETAFAKAVAEYYFRTTAEAVRAADPNHLVLGCRFHSHSKECQEFVEACAHYHDVVTFNFYDYWDITSYSAISQVKSWAAGKPVMVTEFYVKNANQKAPDGTAYNNNEGAGWWVKSQTARGQFYQNSVIRFIEEGTIAGWKWFKWTDDYRNTIPGWVNKGIVSPDYSGTYTDCTSLMKEMHWNMYQCLDYYWGAPAGIGRSAGDLPEGIWE